VKNSELPNSKWFKVKECNLFLEFLTILSTVFKPVWSNGIFALLTGYKWNIILFSWACILLHYIITLFKYACNRNWKLLLLNFSLSQHVSTPTDHLQVEHNINYLSKAPSILQRIHCFCIVYPCGVNYLNTYLQQDFHETWLLEKNNTALHQVILTHYSEWNKKKRKRTKYTLYITLYVHKKHII
jgi:hypothetical protein